MKCLENTIWHSAAEKMQTVILNWFQGIKLLGHELRQDRFK